MNYDQFLITKEQSGEMNGFPVNFMPDGLFDFQESLLEWAINKGRAALFEDCGLGKTVQQLTWAENVHRHTNKPVLILTPLAVSQQTIREGEKFGIECHRSPNGKPAGGITITNYERLHLFDPNDYAGVVCDESSILKSFDGKRKDEIVKFMRKMPYRLLATATAAPNDYIELGTSSEALGYMGAMDMLGKFFKNDSNTIKTKRYYGEAPKWRFKGHSQMPFWRWVTSWARACRKPSDLGFKDDAFILPKLVERKHILDAGPAPGMLFPLPATGLFEQRKEKKRTIQERCEMVAQMINNTGEPAMVWCQLNDEGNLLEKMIPDSVQVSGSQKDEKKESLFQAFADSEARVLITKPKIGAWGLNFQHCNHIAYFPSHSFEQYYQAVRRCWRFGQKREVTVDLIMTIGEERIMENLRRKSLQADSMFESLVSEMNNSIHIQRQNNHINQTEVPKWL